MSKQFQQWLVSNDEDGASTQAIFTEIDVNAASETEDKKEEYGEMPILPMRDMVMFPGVVMPVTIGRDSSMKLVKDAARKEHSIAVLCQKKADVDDPELDDLYPVGVAAKVLRILDMPDQSTIVILQGLDRVRLNSISTTTPYAKGDVSLLPEIPLVKADRKFTAIAEACRDRAIQYIKASGSIHPEAIITLRGAGTGRLLINILCANLPLNKEEKFTLLMEDSLLERGMKLMSILDREVQLAEIKLDINQKTRGEIDKQQKEYFLREQLKNIQNELGTGASKDAEELRAKAKNKKWAKEIAEHFDKEVAKLERTHPQSGEYSTQHDYLQTLVELPWGEYTKDTYNLKRAERILDRDHYGMEKVKERILEYLAVMMLKSRVGARRTDNFHSDGARRTGNFHPDGARRTGNFHSDGARRTGSFHSDGGKAPIICLYGPPGVGKTSISKSLAEALNRKYVRVSLGGVHDESEIRGHRRTYVGAMVGRIIKGISKVQSCNPVFVLDEIDKLGKSMHGDPASALLEVLDPEQNFAFHDNFLDVDYDLSKVMFIATANSLETIPQPLLDRMELINVSGYLTEEKIEIARRHLIPKELEANGFSKDDVKFPKVTITQLIENYTRESGVRALQKVLSKLLRKTAYTMVKEGQQEKITVESNTLSKMLGAAPYSRDKYLVGDYVGVVTGLAWTPVGGEILFIETSLTEAADGKGGKLTLTGQLGNVMKESAMLALEYLRAHSGDLKLTTADCDKYNVHLHVPEGAIPKDGPSAGITMTTALASAFTGRKIKRHLAMTGEITLRGKVLPVGGIKEKILAAKRAGIREIILCEDNRKDILDIAEKYVSGLTFHYVKDINEVLNIALEARRR